MGKRIFLCVAVLLMLSVSCIGFANPVEFTATGMYSLKANDTRETAKKQAVKDAMRHAAQMGAVYVESYSTVNNGYSNKATTGRIGSLFLTLILFICAKS